MKLIVGLGNPGKKYEKTKHNVGFMVIDDFAKDNSINISKIKFKSFIGEGFIGTEKVILMKPQTYMNLSGMAVREAVEYYNLHISDIIVVYDDIDIDFGAIRIRKKGSAGTHNGMRNIIYQLKDDDFPRVRIGIGRPKHGELRDFVISNFTKKDSEDLLRLIERGVKSVQDIIEKGIDASMNLNNG